VGLEHLFAAQGLQTHWQRCLIRRSMMTFKLKLELASGQSLKGAPLELLAKGVPIARGVVDEHGHVAFDAKAGVAGLAVRVDRSVLRQAEAIA
jgi:hypothetical protein